MEVNNNGRFVAGAGTLSLGIIGTALAGLDAVSRGGLPLLGGSNRLAEADSRIAKLEAERYTDAAVIAAEKRAAAQDVVIANLNARIEAAELRAELDREKSKNALIEATAPLASGLASVQTVLANITKVVIPASAVAGGSTRA